MSVRLRVAVKPSRFFTGEYAQYFESFARSIFSAMTALKIVSKCGGTKCQTTCKLRFLLRAPALRPLGQQSCSRYCYIWGSGQHVDYFCLALTTKSSGTNLNVSPEGVRRMDMPNNNLHRAKLSLYNSIGLIN